jgi:hypothetical protein
VLHREGKRKDAVEWATHKYDRSKRYIWDCVRIAKRWEARRLQPKKEPTPRELLDAARLDVEIEQEFAALGPILRSREFKQQTSPAAHFLIITLMGGPRPTIEVLAEAKAKGISASTLRRAGEATGWVKIRKERRLRGRWMWELSNKAKIILRVED